MNREIQQDNRKSGRGSRVVLALDAMGGDFAPVEVVMGAAAVAGPELAITLTGRGEEIERVLADAEPAARRHISIVEAPETIGFDEEPARAVRAKENSSLVAACREVAEGRADGAVSAGNTGAMLAAAMIKLRRIKGLKRPGLCAVLPTPGRPTVFIDVGANAEVRPVHLLEFANMASIFAGEVLEVKNPTVGLVSIGEESVKGNELVLEAHRLMAASPQLNFYGNVEGRDIVRNVVDVVVTDGFTGNVCLKLMESTSSLIVEEVKKAARRSLLAKIGGALLKRELNDFRKSIDTEEFGGAYLLGVRGLVVVCHGNSSRKAIASALGYAARASRQNLTGKLQERIAGLAAQPAKAGDR
ncbi:MAG: phosphate acyltransferase PlsX [Thermoleophilia bacterium]|nr:phosphate acyltransferase PlsX [Actinomycetota bacterium]MCL6093041.1 phosphate acyltransferase PlsX [Actinomycetota bacterium]MDA8167370.1 phosphate acyltransferase PlsX [Actinomycetota bacterium]